jgi:hypothetical protein
MGIFRGALYLSFLLNGAYGMDWQIPLMTFMFDSDLSSVNLDLLNLDMLGDGHSSASASLFLGGDVNFPSTSLSTAQGVGSTLSERTLSATADYITMVKANLAASDLANLKSNAFFAVTFDKISGNLLGKVDTYLDSNPSLKLSASEYVNTVVKPYVSEVGGFLARSPLANNFKSFGEISSNDALKIFADPVMERTVPVVESIGNALGHLFQSLVGPVTQLNDKFEALRPTVDYASTSSFFGGSSNSYDPAQSLKELSENLDVFLSSANEISGKFGIQASTGGDVLARVPGATVEFGRQLGQKFDILSENLVGYTGGFFKNLGKVYVGLSETVPAAIDAKFGHGQLLDASNRAAAGPSIVDVVVDSGADVVSRIKQWKLFSDDNHLANGYWEQQLLSTPAEKFAKIRSVTEATGQGLRNFGTNFGDAWAKNGETYAKNTEQLPGLVNSWRESLQSASSSFQNGLRTGTASIGDKIRENAVHISAAVKSNGEMLKGP